MANQIVISSGAKVRNLNGVLTGTTGVVNSLGINVANGIPQLDGSGKILVSQLPNSVMEYKGTWNAATNTPTLVNGTGNQGDVYLCNVAGTVNFGAGAITFAVGDQAIYSGTIWQKAGGSTGTVTSVAVTETGDALTITGSPITTSGTINIGFAGTSGQYVNGAGGLTTFPSLTGYVTAVTGTAPVVSSGGTTPAISMPVATASVDGYLDNADWTTFNNKQNAITLTTTGTSGAATLVGATLNIPNYSTALSGYVPYTGATTNVNLGTFNLTADVITGATGSFASSGGSDTFAINHSSGSGIALNITKGGAGEGLYINKTSGSGNAATIIGTLNATTLVKSGGTSSQFLKADGSVDSSTYLTTSSAASTYVPYTGATAGLNLGTFGIGCGAIGSSGIALSQSSGVSASSGRTTINGDANGIYINPVTASTNFLSFPASGSRTYTYPNATGTLALTSDLSSYLPLTGGTLSGALNINLGSGTGLNVASDLVVFRASTGFATPRQITLAAGNGATTYLEAKGYGANYITDFGIRTYNASGTAFEVFFATSAGNVGIGNTAPAAKLDVNGTGRFIGAITIGTDFAQLLPITALNSQFLTGSYYDGSNVIATAASGTRTIYNSGGFDFRNFTGATIGSSVTDTSRLTIASTGAATFSSSVTATSGIYNPIDNAADTIRVYRGNTAPYLNESAIFDAGGGMTNIRNKSLDTVRSIIFSFSTDGSTSYTERMRITSGGVLLVGTTSAFSVGFTAQSNGLCGSTVSSGENMQFWNQATSGNNLFQTFYTDAGGGTFRGSIDFNRAAGLVRYNVTSDYRLKTDFKNFNGIDLLSNIKVYDYQLKETGSRVYGVVAHELQEVLPYAVSGEKDGEKMQGVDYSKIVPLLVKAIQELKAEIDELKNK